MLNRDYTSGIQNAIRNSLSLDFTPTPNKFEQLPEVVSKGLENWDNAMRKKAYVDALQTGDQEKIDKALASYDADAYQNVLKDREKRQQELDDIAAQRDFQREMLDAQLKNSFALENLRNQNARGLAEYNAGLAAQNGGNVAFDPKGTMDLRKEFQAGAKDYYSVGDNYAKLQKAAQNPSAAGDISMVFSYMKMLDPGSVVREGEYANAQNAAGVPTRIVNAYNRMLDGTRLSDEQRQDFTNQARNLFEAQKQRYDKQKEFYTGIANASGINPQYVISDPFDFEQQNTQQQNNFDVGATQTFNNGFSITRVK